MLRAVNNTLVINKKASKKKTITNYMLLSCQVRVLESNAQYR